MAAQKSLSTEIWGWAFYDFANSAFATSITSVIFNVYFVSLIVGPAGLEVLGIHFPASSVWSFGLSASMLMVFVLAPTLGAVADYGGKRKQFLIFFCYLGVGATFLLYWAAPGRVWWALTFYIIANVGMEASLPFYNAFLSEIADRETRGRVSGFGWAFGYVGGVLCLILNLAMIQKPEWFGIPLHDQIPVRMTALVVAVWWGLFALPTFLLVRERKADLTGKSPNYFRQGIRRFLNTLRRLRHYRQLLIFLLAFLFFNDGIQTVIAMAAIFGSEALKMSLEELTLCYIFIQLVAFGGALLFGYLADRLTNKQAVQITLYVWSGCVLYALFIQHSWQFWILGGVIGLVLGGSQSASRAMIANFVPSSNSAEFFGFFATCQKASSVLGPALFGLAAQMTGSTRYAIASILIFFVVGLVLLRFVDEQQGLQEGEVPVEDWKTSS